MKWLHEVAGVVGTVDPANKNNSTSLTDAIDMSKFSEVMFVVLTGDMDNTLDFKVQEAATSGGSYSDLSGKAVTQLAAHASNNDNKQLIVSVKSEELSAGKQFVKGSLTIGNGTTNICGVVALGVPRYAPATDDDLSDVVQVVA